jgi:HK97 family phage major capsid protein
MTFHNHNQFDASRARGLASVRNDASANAMLAQLNAAFEEFKAKHNGTLAEINTELEDAHKKISAMSIGGSQMPGDRGGSMTITGDVAASFRSQLLGNPSASMTTQSDPDGGFTVSPQVDNVIDAAMRDLSPLRSLARVVTLNSGTGDWEKIIGRTGSQTVWAGEEQERTDTDNPTLGKVTIVPHEIYAIPSLTNHVLEDSSFDLTSFVREDVSGEFALGEGAAFVSGNGVLKPRGFTTYDTAATADATRAFGTLQHVATGVSGDFKTTSATVSPADSLKDLIASLRPIYRMGGGVAWLMNSTTANIVSKFKDAQGRYVWTDSMIEGQPDRLHGYPVSIDESMPDIAAGAYAIAFGNWQRGYAIVDKPELRLITDRVTRKGWTKLYFSRRVGGGVVDSNAIKLLKFATS